MTSSLMGRVVRFRGGRHREVQGLLPWYLGGRLDADEHERVAEHLKVCAECQAEVRFQQRLGEEISDISLDVERGWALLRRRIAEDAAPRRRASWAPRIRFAGAGNVGALVWRTSPAWGGWATASVLLVAAVIWMRPGGPDGAYHALSAKPAPAATAPGDILVTFKPDAPERDLRAAVKASGAHLVGGPTEADAYILSAPLEARARALAALRAQPAVAMAEPIDPGGGP